MGDTGAEVFLMDGCSGPGERIGAGIVAFDEGMMRSRTCWGEVKLAPWRAERLRIENQISTWFIQEAWVGVKWKRTLG